jgi:hypothetical protein
MFNLNYLALKLSYVATFTPPVAFAFALAHSYRKSTPTILSKKYLLASTGNKYRRGSTVGTLLFFYKIRANPRLKILKVGRWACAPCKAPALCVTS